MVNHPNHYQDFDLGSSGIECLKALRAMLGRASFIDWLRGEIFTYNWRLIRKELPLQDAKKIKWYSNLLEEVLSEIEPSIIRGRSNG